MIREEFNELYLKWRSERMSAAEWMLFRKAVTDTAGNSWLEELIEGEFNRPDFDNLLSAEETKKAYQLLMRQVNQSPEVIRPARSIHFLKRWWAAAILLVALCTGVYLWQNKRTTSPIAVNKTATSIQPGQAGAILTLADGSQVLLDTVKNATIALQGGVTAKVIEGTLVYEGTGNEVVYNTMSTPKGRQYHVTLPDGSGVWLNAASSIRFPTAFVGKERRVEITGEAYFEVKKGITPFIVSADNRATIQVLGTHFNVNSYNNEARLNVTLLEGSVGVSNSNGRVVIKPGEQAQIEEGEENIHVVKGTDVDKVIAWKNGLFNFEGATLKEVMRELERWYDIEVVYEKDIPEIEAMGKISRGISLNNLLAGFKELGVHYRLEGRKLIIMP